MRNPNDPRPGPVSVSCVWGGNYVALMKIFYVFAKNVVSEDR